MPKRTDIQKILIIGSGPIIISQACEFDYSGTQACKALREEGYEIVLINSNPATIMTDPETAHRTYIEPITPEAVAKVIARERPDALLPTLGGQTALNVAVKVAEMGVLERYGVAMIGASVEVIKKAEDRELFRDAMKRIGLRVPASGIARSLTEVEAVAEALGFPVIVRPSFTLGGTGGGVAYNREELLDLAQSGLDASMIQTVMLEESVLGWKEFELEVMRDTMDNVVIVCSIENMDAMGVHTGDSITVAPAQTLTRPGISADAGRCHCHSSRNRRGNGRLQRPVRRQSPRWRDGRDRDEPARLAVFGARFQGYRFPHREDCRQACRRLFP